jgi:hypothetical protein
MFWPTLCPAQVLLTTIWKSLALTKRLIQLTIPCECLFHESCEVIGDEADASCIKIRYV